MGLAGAGLSNAGGFGWTVGGGKWGLCESWGTSQSYGSQSLSRGFTKWTAASPGGHPQGRPGVSRITHGQLHYLLALLAGEPLEGARTMGTS